MYALLLDAEYHRLDDELGDLIENESSVSARSAHVRRRADRAEELQAFRRAITALRTELSARRDGASSTALD
jgi:hypothetical protein